MPNHESEGSFFVAFWMGVYCCWSSKIYLHWMSILWLTYAHFSSVVCSLMWSWNLICNTFNTFTIFVLLERWFSCGPTSPNTPKIMVISRSFFPTDVSKQINTQIKKTNIGQPVPANEKGCTVWNFVYLVPSRLYALFFWGVIELCFVLFVIFAQPYRCKHNL